MSDMENRIKNILVEHLGVDHGQLKDDANFTDDLGADSIDGIELAMALEEEFGIEVTDDDMETVNTVGDFVALATRLNTKSATRGTYVD